MGGDEADRDLYDAYVDAAFQRMISLAYPPQQAFILNMQVRKLMRQAARRRVWNTAVVWVTTFLFPHMWRIDGTTMER